MSKEPSALCVTLLCLKTMWGCEQIVRIKLSLLFPITLDTLYTLSKSVPKCFGSLSMLLVILMGVSISHFNLMCLIKFMKYYMFCFI